MKIVFANYFYDDQLTSEMDLLRQYYTVVGWAEALQKRGCEITVISRFNKNSRLLVNNVEYVFVNDGAGPVVRSWQIPWKFLKAVAALKPGIVHLHHLSLSLQTVALRLLLPKKTAIIIQHHGGKMIRSWKMNVHNFLHRVADGYFFTTREQGEWWFTNRRQQKKIMPVMEGGTFFDFDSRDASPSNLKKDLPGSPVLLWVGRLDENKDPLTILAGFETLLQQFPQARLYMIYHEEKLLQQVKDKISASQTLKNTVQLLGAIPHHEIHAYYNSAAYFVLGSHYEGSGYALSEALRCGCIPIITDIPSFRRMTDDGRLGALWQPENVSSFVAAAKKAMAKPLQAEGRQCIDYFNRALSFDAIARTALKYYEQVQVK
jgi:glycosyltransferase involved in cell wall biosynthesis